jgi:hypothetical protein
MMISRENPKELEGKPASAGLLLNPKDGGDIFLRNFGLLAGLHDISQKIEFFITTVVRTSNPTQVTNSLGTLLHD